MEYTVDYILQYIYGCTDEQLLKEFEAAEKEVPDEVIGPYDPQSFERLWKKICDESK